MGKAIRCFDHLGKEFDSESAMCRHWGVTLSSYKYKMSKFNSVEESLKKSKTKGNRVVCTDHRGIEYPTKKAMCDAYDMSVVTYSKRLKDGATIEQALNPYWVKSRELVVFDHTGRGFTSESAMAKHWGISYECLKRRQSKGYSLEQSLTGVGIVNKSCVPCTDHLGMEFESIEAMAKHWGILSSTYRGRRKLGYSVEAALTTKNINYLVSEE